MKSMKKKLAVLLAAIMMISVILTGCQSKPAPADQTVKALFDLVVQDNAAPMKDLLGFASEDDVRSSLLPSDYVGIADMVSQQFENSGVKFTDDEVKAMTDTLKGLMNKLTCTASIQSQSKDETTVLLKVTDYSSSDMDKIQEDILADVQKNMDQETAKKLMTGDQEATQKLMQDVMDQVIKKMADMQPSTETTDVTVKCEKLKVSVNGKDKVEWMPADMDKFESDLDAAMFK